MARHNELHFVSFALYIPAAKFETHCSNISRDVLDSVFYCFSDTTYDVIPFLTYTVQKANISKTKEDIPKKVNARLRFFPEKPFKYKQ